MKQIKREGDYVIKTSDELDFLWKTRFEKILGFMWIPAFAGFVEGGYKTAYIDGVDLQEDPPFEPRHDIVRAFPLSYEQRKRVVKIFRDVVRTGMRTNCILADFTKRNIIMQGDFPYLIDYDVIVEGPLSLDYVNLWQIFIDYLKIDYKFNGNLKELYEHLN